MPHTPRPLVQVSTTARVLIISQAPGSRSHARGILWDDASGDRLREWLGLSAAQLADPAAVAMLPMGLCYPGRAASGDRPPRPECAARWHDRLLHLVPGRRLTILVGHHAQHRHLPELRHLPMAERVRQVAHRQDLAALPHPSWRSVLFMRRHPWFEDELLPGLRAKVAHWTR
ncbi:uracil-DNA glycosylase family protein [Erythrobacteraceae bacterium CFH 75059]|nr:uracil-DNA glycosylase family protein [Erythrobacteraceae bacterium CFH 75059]